MAPIANLYKDKRVLVTGANGFIGRHLTSALTNQGAQVSVLDEKPGDTSNDIIAQFVCDLREPSLVEQCLQSVAPEIIFHLAAFKDRSSSIESFDDALSVNLTGSFNLLVSAQRVCSVQALVVMGTVDEYGHNEAPFCEEMREAPINAYSFSKVCVTHLCQVMNTLYNLPCTVLRPTVVYGPGQPPDMFLPALIQAIIAGERFLMTKGEQTRDFLFIADLIDALLSAGLCKGACGQVVNIGSGFPVTIAEVARKVELMLGKEGLVQLGALPYRAKEIMDYTVSLDKAAKLLGWQARVELDAGLMRTVEFYQRIGRS